MVWEEGFSKVEKRNEENGRKMEKIRDLSQSQRSPRSLRGLFPDRATAAPACASIFSEA